MAAFKDHFSALADTYASSRPTYPEALYDAIAAVVPASARVWEPGCGSGQATRGLAGRFAHVHATDPSAAQIARHWAQREPAGSVTVAVEETVSGPRVTVKDTGIGIPYAAQGRVFERFYRVDKSHSKEIGGTGLGLSIVKHGAKYHDAQVSLESEPDKGTAVTIQF